MEKEKENTCEKCRYFSHHYVKGNTSYQKVFCGHCLNNEVIKDKRKKGCAGVCDKWETIEIRKEERKTAIIDALLAMAKRVEEMSVILKEDEDDYYKNELKRL